MTLVERTAPEHFAQLCSTYGLRPDPVYHASNGGIAVYLRGKDRGPIQSTSGQRQGGTVLLLMRDEWQGYLQKPPATLGLDRIGWAEIDKLIVGPREEAMDSWWAVVALGAPTQVVPPFMLLEEYDVGHQIVVLEGERLATTAGVSTVHATAVGLGDGTSHRCEAVAAVRGVDLAADMALAPMRHRLPAGSPVWVLVEGESLWTRAVIGEYVDPFAQVSLWLVDRDMAWRAARDRHRIVPRTDNTPPPLPRRPATARDVPPANAWRRPKKAISNLFDEARSSGEAHFSIFKSEHDPTETRRDGMSAQYAIIDEALDLSPSVKLQALGYTLWADLDLGAKGIIRET